MPNCPDSNHFQIRVASENVHVYYYVYSTVKKANRLYYNTAQLHAIAIQSILFLSEQREIIAFYSCVLVDMFLKGSIIYSTHTNQKRRQ